jgi:hypothetical protein
VSPNLRITCGAEPKGGSGTSTDVVSQLFESLILPFGFFNPASGLLSGLNLSRGVYSLLSSSENLEFESVQHLAQALSDIDSIAIALNHMDSEEFAIWCGLGKSNARTHLLQLIGELEQARIRVQGAQLQLDFRHNRPSAKSLFRSLTQLALVGVSCDPRQLQRAWITSTRMPLSKKWISKYESIRVFGGSGSLVEGDALTFVFRVKWKGVGGWEPAIGLVRNRLVIDVGGVRRFVELPAACSRMEPGSVRLSKNKFEIDFAVNESEWPRS